jgi:triosephosphate isomerase
MERKSLVVANWKMNGNIPLIEQMIQALSKLKIDDNTDIVICPSAPYLSAFYSAANKANLNGNICLGAQNVSEHESGAFTGEISATMLKELKVKYVIVGHSERRHIYNETSEQIAKKVSAVLNAGLTPILCIGETEAQRMAEKTQSVLTGQLQPVINEIGVNKLAEVVISYEPVWAIGTGKTASPEMAQETHHFIRQFLANINTDIAQLVPLTYGGSVNATNCDKLFAQTDIDGGLIGGASLKVDEFIVICSATKGK